MPFFKLTHCREILKEIKIRTDEARVSVIYVRSITRGVANISLKLVKFGLQGD
jgi:hypothetical protein